jgi:hypothetical protein
MSPGQEAYESFRSYGRDPPYEDPDWSKLDKKDRERWEFTADKLRSRLKREFVAAIQRMAF